MNVLFVTLLVALLVVATTARKDVSEKSGDAPLVTRRPLNLKCENGFLKTLLALRHTVEHYGIELIDEIGWDFKLHESLGTQLRPTRTLLLNSESLDEIFQADPRALTFFPIRVGVYQSAEGETRLVFQDSNHFVATFDVYEAAEALEALDRILWKLAESAGCTLEGHGVESTDGSTTYALIRTEQAEIVEALELRAEGLPGLITQCGYCIEEVTYNGVDATTNLTEAFGYVVQSFATDYPIPFEIDSYRPEGEILSDESPFTIVTINNDYLTYYLLKSAGQEISAILPISVAVYPNELDTTNSVEPEDLCVSTLGTDYFEVAYGCPLPEAYCNAQDLFFTLSQTEDDDSCQTKDVPLTLEE